MMSKEEYCKAYIQSSAERAMAMAILPGGNRSYEEWNRLWHRTLRSPAG